MVIFVHSPDDDGKFQQLQLGRDSSGNVITAGKATKSSGGDDDDDANLPADSDANVLVLFVGNDKVVLDKATLSQPNFDGWTPLHACCHTVNTQEAGIAILNELVAQRADLNIATKRGPGSFSCGWTPLHIACAYGLEVLALKLIRAGADVNVKNSVGWTPLYEACHRGYASVTRELLKAGAHHDVICPEFALCPFPGQHALAEAARQGHAETVKVLLEWGVDKNAVNKLGWTALHEAAYHSRLAIVKLLVVYGADVFVKTSKGSLAKDVTIHSEIRAMLDDLCQHGPAVSPKKEKAADEESTSSSASAASPKRNSPSKSQSARAAPLSRKEEYALLGDLPSLDTKAVPAISIQDTDDHEDDAYDGDDQSKADDDDNDQGRDAKASQDHSHRHTKPTSHAKKKHHHSRRKKKSSEDAPPEFKCAVSRKVLKDPLRSPYGQVFERHVIEAWFRDFGNRCPLTGEPLTLHQLVPDEKLKTQICEWKHGTRAGGDDTVSQPDDAPRQEDAKDADMASPSDVVTASASADIDPYDF